MAKNTREELQSLSTQFLEIFIQDVLVKNKVNTASVKDSMSEDQRQRLKETVDNLKIQVEDFLKTQTSAKPDKTTESKKEPVNSPLRESLRPKETVDADSETSDE